MNIDLDELDGLAQAATPGPWEVTHGGSVYSLHGDTDGGSCEILYDTFGPGDDSAYIAAASPDVVRALIARVRAAEAERDEALATVAALNKLGQYLKREYGQ